MGRARKTAATGDRPDGPSPGLRRAADIMRTASRHTAAGLLLALDGGEAHPGDLAGGVPITAMGAATLLARLQLAGLVDRRREAGRVYYSLTDHGRAVVDLLRRLGGARRSPGGGIRGPYPPRTRKAPP